MTDEQIIQIASSYLRELWSGDIGDAVWQPLEEDALLKFARVIYTEGFKVGYDEGWESSNVSTKMNTWSSDDD